MGVALHECPNVIFLILYIYCRVIDYGIIFFEPDVYVKIRCPIYYFVGIMISVSTVL